jgi:hypothetical protein
MGGTAVNTERWTERLDTSSHTTSTFFRRARVEFCSAEYTPEERTDLLDYLYEFLTSPLNVEAAEFRASLLQSVVTRQP